MMCLMATSVLTLNYRTSSDPSGDEDDVRDHPNESRLSSAGSSVEPEDDRPKLTSSLGTRPNPIEFDEPFDIGSDSEGEEIVLLDRRKVVSSPARPPPGKLPRRREPWTRPKLSELQLECSGVVVPFPPGQEPYGSYPFGLHQHYSLPWDIHIVGGILRTQSSTCHQTRRADKDACEKCLSLLSHTVLKGIIRRLDDGIHENTPHHYKPIGGLISVIRRKDDYARTLLLINLTETRKLARRAKTLDDHKKFLMAVASGKVQRIHALVSVAMRGKASIRAILERFEKAAKGVYRPRGFDDEEMMRGLLFLRLGGARVAQIAHRSLGLPSVSTLRRNSLCPPLLPSPSTPTIAEIQQNIDIALPADLMKGHGQFWYSIMFDELKTEERP